MKDVDKIEDIDIDDFLEYFYKLKTYSKEEQYGFDDKWEVFIKKILFLSPKSYGTKIENRLIFKHKLNKVAANLNKGDFEKSGKFYEIKTSILTPTNNIANITGIRLWQNISGYFIFIIDARILKNIIIYPFFITKEDMVNQQNYLSFTPTSGTKEINKNNNNISMGFHIKVDENDDNFKKWREEFSFENQDVIKENFL